MKDFDNDYNVKYVLDYLKENKIHQMKSSDGICHLIKLSYNERYDNYHIIIKEKNNILFFNYNKNHKVGQLFIHGQYYLYIEEEYNIFREKIYEYMFEFRNYCENMNEKKKQKKYEEINKSNNNSKLLFDKIYKVDSFIDKIDLLN